MGKNRKTLMINLTADENFLVDIYFVKLFESSTLIIRRQLKKNKNFLIKQRPLLNEIYLS
jgi:hypothetical protein